MRALLPSDSRHPLGQVNSALLPAGDPLPWVSLFKTPTQFARPHPSFFYLEMFADTCLGPQVSLGR